MSKGQNSPGISHLAGVVSTLAEKRLQGAASLDLATLQEDRSILLNGFSIPIPVTDYLATKHFIESEYALEAGDRLLVGWIGSDVVVIDRVLPASRLFE